jgi:opine dehydrogenase
MKIGIYAASSQSGRAYLADFLKSGYQVYGYARRSVNGQAFVEKINSQGGIFLERPPNKNMESSQMIELGKSGVGHDIAMLINSSDIIIIAHPSHYLIETVTLLKEAGIAERRIPIILSPPRTFSVPYLWQILGEGYPFVCFSTCPYSCKAPSDGSVYIKRRKRSWFVSLEGRFKQSQVDMIKELYPQALHNHIPATTSIGNIGAVFHPGTYLLNLDDILRARKENREYSFYMEGIASNKECASHLEAVDQIRLKIAAKLGLNVFGLKENPNEDIWQEIMDNLRSKEQEVDNDIEKLRRIRHEHLNEIKDSITSAQHWLDYTYGVRRIPGESLQSAIARTPTYQKRSVPQKRYIEEDIPTGLVPIKAIAERLNIDVSTIDLLLKIYERNFGYKGKEWRDLKGFSTEYITNYLVGRYFYIDD